MSRNLEKAGIEEIVVLLSAERLQPLIELTGSRVTAVELHQDTLRVSAGLMNVIACVELALRNTICVNLTAFFGTSTWLTHPPASFRWKELERKNSEKALDSARRAIYSKLSQAEKAALDGRAYPNGRPPNTSHLKRAKDRRRQINVSEGKIIAEVTFHFWKRLFSADYEHALWRPTLKRTFPNKGIKRADVADQLEHIYQARNRIAHHEPVLHKRFADAINAIEFISMNLGVSDPAPDAPLATLIRPDLERVIGRADELHHRLARFKGA